MHKGEVRDTCGEACKHGVEHCNCRRKRSRTSESVSSDRDMAHRKPQNVVPVDSSFMARSNPQSGHSKYLEQMHPNRSGNTQINTLELKEKDRKNFKKGARGNWREKAVDKGKTKYLSTKEVQNMLSEGKKGEPTRVGPVSSNPKYGPSKYSVKSHTPRSGNTQNNTSVQEAKELKSISTPEKEHCQMRQILSVKDIKTSHAKNQKELGETPSASQMSRHSPTCHIPDATLSPEIALTSTEVITRTDGHLQRTISNEPCADCHSPMSVKEFFIKAAALEPLPTDPAPDASWMGSFILKDEKISMSFLAHPTSQDDKDIGLYFFPSTGMRLDEYISQLEKLSGNVFLRSCINGVELLVFTSKVLHKDYRKRNTSDFLWGMFRRRHGKSRGAVEETPVADRDIGLEDSHREVDMADKKIVGTHDAVIRKQSTESNIGFPPGFSPSKREHWI
ncbi:hypothetical protein POM88_000340 [Heracleum sosnowskyi]|uniref:AIPP2-like SPOC-like domain-containing protein n=1 Tax=Heracleum sosnowskyi TaxID=360622 RepID=A0AAD8JE35_9APIA|nr:hypothetical protein POM88_000340 [Heracleum sosnowskyi]